MGLFNSLKTNGFFKSIREGALNSIKPAKKVLIETVEKLPGGDIILDVARGTGLGTLAKKHLPYGEFIPDQVVKEGDQWGDKTWNNFKNKIDSTIEQNKVLKNIRSTFS